MICRNNNYSHSKCGEQSTRILCQILRYNTSDYACSITRVHRRPRVIPMIGNTCNSYTHQSIGAHVQARLSTSGPLQGGVSHTRDRVFFWSHLHSLHKVQSPQATAGHTTHAGYILIIWLYTS